MGIAATPTSNGARAVRRAPESLPCCVRPLLQLALYDMVYEDDDFVTVARKTMFFGLGLFGWTVCLSPITRIMAEGVTFANTWFACGQFLIMLYTPAYAYVRATKSAPTGLMCAALSVTIASTLIVSLAEIYRPYYAINVMVCMLIAIVDLPRPALWLIAMAVPLLLTVWNESSYDRETFVKTPLMVSREGAVPPSFVSRAIPMVGLMIPIFALAAAVVTLTSESRRQIEQARRAALVAATVAQRLARYDTEAARAILDVAGCESGSDAVSTTQRGDAVSDGGTPEVMKLGVAGTDPALVEALSAIVDNLEKYRPHLPNWLLNAAMKHTSSDAEDDQASSVPTASGDTSRGVTADDVTTQCSRRSRRSTGSGGSRRTDGHCAVPHQQAQHAALKVSAFAPTDTYRKGLVARAHVEFAVAYDRLSRTTAAATLNAFVEGVLAAARGTHAALHSFVGDAVAASWNAASATAQPDAKAARFLLRTKRLVAALNDDAPAAGTAADAVAPRAAIDAAENEENDEAHAPALRAWGAACVGAARVQLAGKGLQLGLTICAAWQATLLELARLARTASGGTFLVDEPCAEAARDLETRGVACVESSAARGKPVLVFEVLREAAAANDEWLYVVSAASAARDAQSTSPAAASDRLITTALYAAVAGQLAAAREHLMQIDDATSQHPLVLALRRRVEAAIAAKDVALQPYRAAPLLC